MNYIATKVRWISDQALRLEGLGIESDDYVLKTFYLNKDLISFIYEYDGVCVVGYSEETLITDIDWNDREILMT